MSHARSHPESVEEAVFKYVGVDLQGGKHNDDADSVSEFGRRLQKDQHHHQHHQHNEVYHGAQDHGHVGMPMGVAKKNHHQRFDQLLANDALSKNVRMSNSSSTGSASSRHSPGPGTTGPATAADVEWFLRHELGPESATSPELDVRGSREPQSVAAAAVAAAFGSAQDEDSSGGNKIHGGATGLKNHQVSPGGRVNVGKSASGRHKRHKASAGSSRHNQLPKLPHLGAVDPELASLDDPEDVTEHEQLVRKAILDADSIAHHPDFQHYLNTDDDTDDRARLSSVLHHKSTHDHGRKIEVLPKVSGTDSSLISRSDSENGPGSLLRGQSRSDLHGNAVAEGASLHTGSSHSISRTLSGAGAGNGSDDQDISHLIQDAAAKASNFISPQSQSTGKSFDAAEEQALEHFIGEYQAIKSLSRRQICERIWSNERRKDDFWTNICKVLPYRTRSSIYKHVRRKYHIFEQRGKWTPEEEQELATLCIEKEGQWSEIGKILGRMPEDCRDRWRNYVKCGTNRASNKWSAQEEEQLKQVISELLDSTGYPNDQIFDTVDETQLDAKGDKVSKKRDTNSREAINWTVVSERMGGARSRIQCRYKWNKLLKKQAMSKIKNISEEDKMWILEKLRDMGFTEDSQVDWDELATLMPGRQWSGTELKLCYEKLRTGVRYHKDRTINQICKELIGTRDEGLPLDTGNLLGAKR
ncbi:LADA_0B07118g1_1 [Lachancea dasiensis]|uniref:LADA_0B07118g1_1 n=1 Tax=Lachancea dasiensis TaxID=1072105 RepID=A0A1G4ITZ3_9SACH|nr:LADA_0B07118g1_1 [Lachancea dasiensis]